MALWGLAHGWGRDIQMISEQGADSSGESSGKPQKRLIERLREEIRARHYSRRTEKAYWHWIRRFIFFHGKRHPAELDARDVTTFLSWLATERDVAAATQNQALSALLFLYKNVLGRALPWLDELVLAQRPVRLPVVLTEAEVRRPLDAMEGTARLMAGLLYGSGLRQIECLSLRVNDIDFAYRQVVVRDGKGARDRATMLPENLVQPLQRHLGKVRLLHERDVQELLGHSDVSTTMIYTHVMNKGARGVKSPLDRLEQGRAAYAAA
jgi:site-specific recombinase XerD